MTLTMCELYRSTIGKKITMAASGAVLFLFVVGHMVGNWKVFAGCNAAGKCKLDIYARFLRDMGYPVFDHGQALWIVRIVLIVCVVVHGVSAYLLTQLSHEGRPVNYKKTDRIAADYASRTMRWGGVILGLFIVYHIMHLTLGVVHPPGFKEGHVYSNVMISFKYWYIVLVYVLAVGALGFHLYHGLWSACQTLGFSTFENEKRLRWISRVIGVCIFFGFAVVPLAVFFGLVS